MFLCPRFSVERSDDTYNERHLYLPIKFAFAASVICSCLLLHISGELEEK